jgi:hypothetical protein
MATQFSDEQKLKDLMKSAVLEALEERKDLVRELVEEALEDAALARAIEKVEPGKTVSREEVFSILDGNH